MTSYIIFSCFLLMNVFTRVCSSYGYNILITTNSNRTRLSKWNDLKVTWGRDPSTSFNSMPRKVAEAEREGFVKISDCLEVGQFRGNRYAMDDDKSLILLYDNYGYIAGIQTMVPHGMPYDYPERGLTPPFVELDDGFYLTAYFVPPNQICSYGRTPRQFVREGTGNTLLIQNGSNPQTNFMEVPRRERDLMRTKWVQGKCFHTMGRHYWYDISVDMNCDHFFPVFLLYNNNQLNGFGWTIGADLPSPRLEHPNPALFGLFITEPPRCLYERGRYSTMHIYFDNTPLQNRC